MKVIEKGADRTAEAHIYLEGQVRALEEYGQYVDAYDRAICCYVAVEEGQQIRVDGRFSGMTLVVAYDILVDGVCRKANSYVGKSVQVQKKKLDFETFLFQTADGVIDTGMSVAPYQGAKTLSKQALETVGTLELRVYITRQFDIEHEIDDVYKYDKVEDNVEVVATYKDVPPHFRMMFEKNCSTLDGSKGTREKRKVYAKRPGHEPWAIFRFHYRNKESIIDRNMDLTFDPTDKSYGKKEAHALELEPVPMLLLGSKPAGKNDGEASARTSSPAPPDSLPTPMKGSRKSQAAEVREGIPSPKVVVKKQQAKPTPITTAPSSAMPPFQDRDSATAAEAAIAIAPDAPATSDLQPTATHSKGDTFTTTPSTTAPIKDPKKKIPAATQNSDGDLAAGVSKRPSRKEAMKRSTSTDTRADTKSKVPTAKDEEKADGIPRSDVVNATPQILHVETSNTPTIPHPADMPSVFDTLTAPGVTAIQATTITSTKEFVKNGTKAFNSPLKKATTNPAAIEVSTSTVIQKSVVPQTPAIPLKRAPEGTRTPPPDIKRVKTKVAPPLTPTRLPRHFTASPGPRSPSIEAQVAETRKQLEEMRKKRVEIAKKRADVEERLAPHKQRMTEELERLKQEMAEEELLMAEEEQEYNESKSMLAEVEGGDSGL